MLRKFKNIFCAFIFIVRDNDKILKNQIKFKFRIRHCSQLSQFCQCISKVNLYSKSFAGVPKIKISKVFKNGKLLRA